MSPSSRKLFFGAVLLAILLIGIFTFSISRFGSQSEKRAASSAAEDSAPAVTMQDPPVVTSGPGGEKSETRTPTAPSSVPPTPTGNSISNARIVLPRRGPTEELSRRADKATPPGVYRFAEAIPVDLSPENSGIWTDEGSEFRWKLEIESTDARSLNLGFDRYHMPAGGSLQIYAPENANSPTYRPFTAADNEEHGQLWTPLVRGDRVVIDVRVPKESIDELELKLAQVSHGFRGVRPADKSDASRIGGATTQTCHVDVACSDSTLPGGVGLLVDAYRDQIRSVGAFTLNGIDTCSGALINNTRNDTTPYFLTAEHCGITTFNASTMVVYWNYENSTCRTPNTSGNGDPGDGDLSQFNSGAIFRAADATSDFCLVELDDPLDPAFHLHFSGWDRTTNDSNMATGIHHPAVAEKRICFELDPTQTTSILGETPIPGAPYARVVDWDHGVTAPGSSGSPLYNQDGRIMGQLYGGYSVCGDDLSDYYGRISTSWNGGGSSSTRLSDWLDPDNTGALTVDGINQDDTISIDDVILTEGNSGTQTATFTVTLTRFANELITVDWTTEDETATIADGDYVAANGTLTFAPAETTKTVSVTVNGDTNQEEHEVFRVALSNPTNAQLADAVGFGAISNDDFVNPPIITSSLTATGVQHQLFTYQIEALNTPTSYSLGGTPPTGMTVSPTGLVSWTPDTFGTFPFVVEATSPAGTGNATVTVEVEERSLENALDNSLLSYATGGDASWEMQTAVSFDGEDAARSGDITDDEESHFTYFVPGPDVMIFYWRVSSESRYDFLELRRNGNEIHSISGETDWERVVIQLPSGPNTFRFRYTKDYIFSDGDDAGYVDRIRIGATTPTPMITSAEKEVVIEDQAFSYQITTSIPADSFGATNLPAGLTLDTETGLITGFPTTLGTHEIELSATNGSGTETLEFRLDVLPLSPSMTNILGGGLIWGTAGDLPWHVEGSVAQSGEISDLEDSVLLTFLEGPAELAFDWFVDSEDFFDYLEVRVDNEVIDAISGSVGWTNNAVVVGEGTHKIEFRYVKDITVSAGEDYGRIDNVVVTPLPGSVTSLTATDGTVAGKVDLSWSAAAGSVDRYLLYRAQEDDSGAATQIGTATSTQYSDSTAVAGLQYFYFVLAENGAGTSEFSAGDAGHVQTDPPESPTNLSVTKGTYDDRIRINWYSQPNIYSYTLYRSESAGDLGSSLAEIPPNTTSYFDLTALPGQRYYYSIAATNVEGTGSPSASQHGYRLLSPPDLAASTDNEDGIFLSWTSPAGTIENFTLLRGETTAPNAATILATLGTSETTFLDSGMNPGATFHYWLRAENSDTAPSELSDTATGVRPVLPATGLEVPSPLSPAPGETPANYEETAKGSYQGLVSDNNAPVDSAKLFGMARATIAHRRRTDDGIATVVLTYEGSTYRIRTELSANGNAVAGFSKRDESRSEMTLTLQLVDTASGKKLSGLLTGDGQTSRLSLYQRTHHPRLNPAPEAGRYALVFPHDESADSSTQPGGDGAGSLSIGTNGLARVIGTHGDGERLAASGFLSPDGELALYQTLYRRDARGWMGGILRFARNENLSSADGQFHWFKGADSLEPFYSDGFDLQQQEAIASPYSPPNLRAGEFILSDLLNESGNALLYLDGGNFTPPIAPRLATWDSRNRITLDFPGPTEIFRPLVNLGNGLVNGVYLDRDLGRVVHFSGIAFQEQDKVVGHFRGDGESGFFQLNSTGEPGLTITRLSDDSPIGDGDTLDFGDTGHDGGLGEIGIRLENSGTAPLHLRSSPQLSTSTPNEFGLSSQSMGTLMPGEFAILRLRFAPSSPGAKTASLTIFSNAAEANPFSIDFTGNGVVGNGGLGAETWETFSLGLPGNRQELASGSAENFDADWSGRYNGVLFRRTATRPGEGTANFLIREDRRSGLGLASGVLSINGTRLRCRGEIQASGELVGFLLGRDASDWTIEAQLHSGSEGGEQLAGTLTHLPSGSIWDFITVPNRFHPRLNPPAESGRYTAILPASEQSPALYPGGHGHGAFTISPRGTTRILLTLSDGNRAVYSGFLSEDLQMPIFASGLSGVVTFRDLPGISDADGELRWTSTPSQFAPRYPRGFDLSVPFLASRYDPAPANGWLLPSVETAGGNVSVELFGREVSESLPVFWDERNRITHSPSGTELLRLTIIRGNGLVRGFWWDRENGQPRKPISGVLLQKQEGVFGNLLAPHTVGTIEINP